MTRSVYFAFGLFLVGLGFVGAFLPLLPTVPFLLLTLWCLARSSQRFHDWLYRHPRFGEAIQQWDRYRVIPVKAKVASCGAMALSMPIMLLTTDLSPWAYAAMAGMLMAIAAWIVMRPSHPPEESR